MKEDRPGKKCLYLVQYKPWYEINKLYKHMDICTAPVYSIFIIGLWANISSQLWPE